MIAGDAHTEQPVLEGRKAIITGGTTGIGRAIAVLLASEGAQVFVCGQPPEHLDDALARIAEVGTGSGIVADLAIPKDLASFFAAARNYLGEPDIVVVNAAVPAKGLADMGEDDLRYAIATDFTAYVISAHAGHKLLGDHGDIVLIGSMSAHVLGPGSTVYAGMKGGSPGSPRRCARNWARKASRPHWSSPARPGPTSNIPRFPPRSSARDPCRNDAACRRCCGDGALSAHSAQTRRDPAGNDRAANAG